jgi:membrane-bound serine protease (ClpP class)
MRIIRLIYLLLLAIILLAFQPVSAFAETSAQTDSPLVIVLDAEGAVAPAMQEYIQRGLDIANRRNADMVILQLDTPGGSIDTMNTIIQTIRDSRIP